MKLLNLLKISKSYFSVENFPSVFIHKITKRKKGYLFKSHPHQIVYITFCVILGFINESHLVKMIQSINRQAQCVSNLYIKNLAHVKHVSSCRMIHKA